MRSRVVASKLRARKKSNKLGEYKLLPYTPGPVVSPALTGRNRTPEPFRHDEYLHVSDLLRECIRKVAISEVVERPILRDPLYFNIQLVFEQGRAVERFLTEQLKAKLPKELYGHWRCSCELVNFTGTYEQALDESPCPKCETKPVNYHEIQYKDNEYMISGSVDFHLFREGALIPIESKSVNASRWQEMTSADPNHVSQVLMYWHLMNRKKFPLHDVAVIMYTGKDIYRGYPIKEYPQHASRSMNRIEVLIEEASEWSAFKHNGALPPRRCCTSERSPKARKCQFAQECFHEFG